MRRIYLFILSQICLISFVNAQVLCLDESNRKPVSEVILLDGNGGVIDLTDELGVAKSISSAPNSSSPVTFSHMAYEPVVKTVQAGDTIWLTPRSFVLPEAVVLAVDPNADFVKLSTLVRSYQYIEEVPAYFTEAIVDFLIPKKGNKLTYQLHSVRAYRNDKLIKESGTESGSLRMAQNGLTNFLLNTPFPLSHNYEVRSAENPSSYDIYLNGVKKGEIQLTTSGEYAVLKFPI